MQQVDFPNSQHMELTSKSLPEKNQRISPDYHYQDLGGYYVTITWKTSKANWEEEPLEFSAPLVNLNLIFT